MASITEQFTRQVAPPWEAHPLYRAWKRLLAQPGIEGLRVSLWRPREGLTYAPTKLYVHLVHNDGTEGEPAEYFWDPVANEGLLHLGARCTSSEDEIMRFALMARDVFLPVEERVGQTYFNSVFLERMRSDQFAGLPKLAAKLAELSREYPANRSDIYEDCVSQIDNAVAQLSSALVSKEQLGYEPAEADKILDGALAQYVDERFSVTNRKLLGW